jgi:hypothetical protein
MNGGLPDLAETLTRLSATAPSCQDVEIVRHHAGHPGGEARTAVRGGRPARRPVLNVMVTDPDVGRAHDTFAALASGPGRYGLRPCMEGISYTAGTRSRDGVPGAGRTGGGTDRGSLHIQRSGDDITDLRRVDPSSLGYLQLCDGPRTCRKACGPGPPAARPGGRRRRPGNWSRARAAAARREGDIPVADFAPQLPADLR